MSKCRTIDCERHARIFKALSNPHRLSIFMRLVDCCGGKTVTCDDSSICECVGDLGRDLGIAASTLSHHVKELQQAGLIETQRSGQTILCRVSTEALEDLAAFFQNVPAPA